MSDFEKLEAEVFRELRRQGISLPDDQLRCPVIDGQYVGPNYETREALKYGLLRSPDERINGMVRCWIYYCTALWCARENRQRFKSFASYLASDHFRSTLGVVAEWAGFDEMLAAT